MAIFERIKRAVKKEETTDKGRTLPVNEDTIRKWNEELKKYHDGKRRAEAKIRSNEEFWRIRQWEYVSDETNGTPSSAWLWTCIQSKLADVMDSYPTANFRARQKDDEREAKFLRAVVPIIMEQNDFESTYHDVSEYTLKNGVGIYGIFWDSSKHNGLGDVAIEKIDVFNIFWEPGITDIQSSRYVFNVKLESNADIEGRYPETKGKLGKTVELSKYIYSDGYIDYSDKSPVVDVYYHTFVGDKRILHFAKYVGNVLLASSENEPERYPDGWYEHGMFPFEVQPLYHTEGTLFGMGITDIGRDTQLMIDLISEGMMKNALMGASPRYFVQRDSGINKDGFADWRETFVEVPSLSEQYIKRIEVDGLPGNYISFLQMKIEELKYVTSNHDANNGAAPSGITAASAIAALQETAGKNSRSINKTFYRTYRKVVGHVIELIRQFYDTSRQFRVSPDIVGIEEYVTYNNQGLKPQPNPLIAGQDMGLRRPEFDIEVSAEKENPYRKLEINELAINFYKLGFFNPEMCDQALSALEMMDFNHKGDIIERIEMNGSMQSKLIQYRQLLAAMAEKYNDAELARIIGADMNMGGGRIPLSSTPAAAEIVESGGGREAKHMQKARSEARSSTEAT